MQIVDAVEKDGLLRYWGFSYGTVLGSTVAAMFPDRIDRVVLDGVVNNQEYWAGIDVEAVTDADVSFSGFFDGCIANPDKCALAKDAATAEDLSRKFFELLHKIKHYPLAFESSLLVDYKILKSAIREMLYDTAKWPSFASAVHGLLAGNATAILQFPPKNPEDKPIFPNKGLDSPLGIKCSDGSLRIDKLTEVYPLVTETLARSSIVGDIWATWPLTCPQWPFQVFPSQRTTSRKLPRQD